MRRSLLFVFAIVAAVQTPAAPDDARTVVDRVTRAVESGNAARLRSQLDARIARQPGDRSARLQLATLHRLQYDYPSAERAYGILIDGPPDDWTLYAHLGLAEGYEARSMARLARSEFDAALADARAIGDRIGQSETLLWLTFSRGRIEGVAVAEALLDSATKLMPDTAWALQSMRLHRRAIIHALRARTVEATAAAESSLVMARRAGRPRLEAEGWNRLGQILQYRGSWDSALVALRRSETLHLASHNRSVLASNLIWHAQVLAGLGRYGEMRDVMARALSEGEATNNPAAIADAKRAFGVLATMMGDWQSAATNLRESAEVSAESGDSSSVMVTDRFRARVAVVAGDLETARRITEEQLEWARRTEDANVEFESLRALANISEREGDTIATNRALAGARERLALLPGNSYRSWIVHDDARYAIARGHLAEAARHLERYITFQAGVLDAATRFDARVRLADVRAGMGEIAAAERELERATDEIDAWRASSNDADIRTRAFQTVATIDAATADPAALTSAAARVLAALVRADRVPAAFELAERWRARELTDRLARAAALRPDTAAVPAGPITAATPRSHLAVREAIDDDSTAIVEFVVATDAPITAFVLQRDSIRAHVLETVDSLAPSIERLSALIQGGSDGIVPARRLGAALIQPIAASLDSDVRRIIIVPDGLLHRVPFDALRLADGRFVPERFALGTAPSASAYAALHGRARAESVARLLAFADPRIDESIIDTAADADASVVAARAAGGLPKLRGARREARRVARFAPESDVLAGARATADYLKHADLGRYRVLHFATHAIVDETSIAGTALALAPAAGQSGFVRAGEIASLRIPADLVVLSACSSAGGVLAGSEGVLGLSSAFLQAGARSLVATAWRIPDRDVVPLIESLYAGLARGLPLMDALTQAKLEAIRRGQSPATWAAFVAIGDPLTTVPLVAARPWWRRWLHRETND